MKLALFLFLLMTSTCFAKEQLKIAVVDTGLDITDPRLSKHLCATGHNDFTGTGLQDTEGHGTFVTALIEKYASNGDYCLLIYKFYSYAQIGIKNTQNEVSAFQKAIKNGAKLINFSGGGNVFDENEYLVIKNNPNVTFVVAAGNDNLDLDIPENKFYPASLFLNNEVVVKNIDSLGNKAETSNWAKEITESEVGEKVQSLLPMGRSGYMTGTSFSTAIRTGKMIRGMLDAK